MKRPLRSAAAWLFACLLAGPLEAQQLLQNGGLEDKNPSFWNHPLYGPGVVRHGFSETEGFGGSSCLTLEGLVPRGRREWFQDVREGFTPGKSVSAGLQVRGQGLEGEAWLEVRAIHENRIVAHQASTRLGPGIPEGEWRRLSLVLMVPEGTAILRVAAVLEGRGKVFLDDFLLVPGESLPAGPEQAVPPAPGEGPGSSVRGGARSNGSIYQVRASLEVRALGDVKGAQLFLALPSVDAGQCPFYYQVHSLPADGIREMRARRPAGPGAPPPHLEIKLQNLRSGGKLTLDLETRLLLLPSVSPAEVPDAALESPSWPSAVRPYLAQTNLTRAAEPQWIPLLEGVEGTSGFWKWLSTTLEKASSLESPALALAGALRGRGLPARLLTGVVPVAGPTAPVLCVETWLPGPGWVRLLPVPPVLSPAPAELLALRAHPPSAEMRASRFLPGQPENALVEASGSIQVLPRLDPAKGLFLECREVSVLDEIPEGELARLRGRVQANWDRWLAARLRGKGETEAEFAGQAASQTKNLEEMLRFLK